MLPTFRRPQWRTRPPAGRAKYLALFMAFCAAMFSISLGAGPASAAGGGGTAKPPKGAVSPWVIPNLADPAPFRVSTLDIRGFDVTGFIQAMTVSANNAACPAETDPARLGGTVRINNVQYTIPCNLVIQMPANTFRWADFVNAGPSFALGGAAAFPSFEVRLVGNIVGGPNSPNKLVPEHIAGLAYLSQQSVNTGTGTIIGINYATGNLQVDDGTGNTATVQINDPNGRFGRAQSPDPRLSVDDANPTIHAGTGYPMCVPRTDPTVTDDPLCPQQNRPARKAVTVGGAPVPAVTSCRLFSTAGIALPASGDLTQTAVGSYCSQFVMNTVLARAATDPDPRQQAPFEVGDFINYSGTLINGAGGPFISAHTIEANLGIYTQPGSQPSYLAIGEFGIGTADLSATAVNGAAQETQNRIFLESETTDVKTPVDIYMTDVNPTTGVVRNRWITPTEMTGENAAGAPSGGITTQNTGPQPQRARIRATKAPNGLLNQPTRNVRIAVRSLCLPTPVDPTVLTINQAALDACFAGAPTVANGLQAGMYTAPTFEYIFPENVKPGDLPVPNDLWHLPALRNGEGSGTPAGVGALSPTPW